MIKSLFTFVLPSSLPNTMFRISILTLLVTVTLTAGAQYDFDGRYCYPESMREDLSELVQAIKAHHPDPYRYTSEPEFEAMVGQIRKSFDTPMSVYGYMNSIMPLLKTIGDAHTTLHLPLELEMMAVSKTPLIPVQVSVDGDRLYLMDELKGFRTIHPGSELVSINGFAAGDILKEMRLLVSNDGLNKSFTDHVISQRFPLLYHQAIERAASFEVVYKDPKGSKDLTARLKALSAQEMESAGRSPIVKNKSLQWTTELLQEGSIVWLRTPTFSDERIEKEGIRPERILKECAKQLESGGVRTLVVDVRGSSGMNFELAEAVYRMFAKGSFRALSNMQVQTFTADQRFKVESFPKLEMSLLKERMENKRGKYQLNPKDQSLSLVQSVKKPFTGDVYIIQDGGTIEAAAAVSVMTHRDKRGLIVGKESGTNATSFCGGRPMTIALRRTGVRLSMPLIKYQMERGSNPISAYGIRPDHQVHLRTNDPDHATQAVEQDLLMFISEWR